MAVMRMPSSLVGGMLFCSDFAYRQSCFAGGYLLHAPWPVTNRPFVACGRGGIGRRAALRSLWGNPWKFESSRPHQFFFSSI